MRHTFATNAITAGVPTSIVSGLLGHASVSITEQVYVHVLQAHVRTAAAQMDEWVQAQRNVGADVVPLHRTG